MRRGCIAVLVSAGLIAAVGCGGSTVNPYAVTCGELRKDSGLADEVTAAIARDVHQRREKVPVTLIESDLELVPTYCGASVDAMEKPGREAYEGEVEWLDPSPERLRGLGG